MKHTIDDPMFTEAMEELLMGDQAVARDLFLELEKKYPEDVQITYTLGIIFYGLGELVRSVEYCQKTIELKEDSGNAHYRLGVCYFRMGRFAEAMASFKRSTEIAGSRQAMVYYYLGLICIYVGDDENAISYLGQLREASPQTTMALFLEAQLRVKTHDFEKAVELLKEFLEYSPDFAEAHYQLGMAFVGLHHNTKALHAFSRVLQLDPDDKRSAMQIDRLTDPY